MILLISCSNLIMCAMVSSIMKITFFKEFFDKWSERRKKKIKDHKPYPESFYLEYIPKGFILISIIVLIAVIVTGILSSLDTSAKDWYYAYEYFANIALTPLIFSLYLIILGLYLSGKKTAGLKIIMSGLIINYITIIFAFAWWYSFLSQLDAQSFSASIDWIKGLSISVGLATTIGYEGIDPISWAAQLSVIVQQIISFIISIILIAWIMTRMGGVIDKKSQTQHKSAKKASLKK